MKKLFDMLDDETPQEPENVLAKAIASMPRATAAQDLTPLVEAIKALGIEPERSEVAMIPQNYVKLTGKEAQQMLKLMEAIEDHDDVQRVTANFDIPEDVLAELAG